MFDYSCLILPIRLAPNAPTDDNLYGIPVKSLSTILWPRSFKTCATLRQNRSLSKVPSDLVFSPFPEPPPSSSTALCLSHRFLNQVFTNWRDSTPGRDYKLIQTG